MTGPKLNEKNFVAGEKAGTRASALYIRSSASKARLVLNIIRDLPVKQADEVLQFTDKGIAVTIRKVLASAVANAQHNDAQDPEELFVKACFADEGPTLRRFAARARGRGTRINKRTCHITIVVDRLDDTRLAVVQAKDANRTASGRRRGAVSSTSARRERVARSRERAQGLKAGSIDADDITETESELATTDAESTDTEAIESTHTESTEAPETETTTAVDDAPVAAADDAAEADEAPAAPKNAEKGDA